MSAVKVATDEDFWTCRQVKCGGVWTTQEFAEQIGRGSTIWYPIYCQAINPLSRHICARCGFPRPEAK